ncbi:hypothetical protein NBRC10512_006863 [Rhodotorula toruloides]|uniref:RHTO0S31e00144g1_1 n=2 Tax=Rhodotorula toruloides TaxID=5286 RepID=A0A061BJZ9_RHOTO|nr:DNA polymerase sigma-like protein [Rhodotorula toruloides NP11]EMS21496.1 DNA polymerase sigma-like protein [Rhodotorula toruloides NP11]CDR49723.1 RHTO0S31e00144g1_1 [Rhodotorula toruloides]
MPASDGALESALDGPSISSGSPLPPRSTRRESPRRGANGANGAVDEAGTVGKTREEILAPWMARLGRREDDGRTPLDLLNEEIDAFLDWVRPTEQERKLRQDVFVLFKRVVRAVWPHAKVQLFGSMATGLYLPDGDFDIVDSSPAFASVPTNTLLLKLKHALLASNFARQDDVSLITGARVPIVKLTSAPEFGSFRMNVCFNSPKGPLGAQESLRLLEEVDKKRPDGRKRVEAHALLLKTLLRTHGLDEVRFGGLSGMTIFCLAVSFVQLDNSQGRTLAADFLYLLRKYALSFDFCTQSLSTANGGRVLSKFQWLRPGEIRRDRLSIVHPVEPTRDVAAGSHRWFEVRQKLQAVYADLAAYVNPAQPLHHLAFSPTKSALSMFGIRASQVLVEIRERHERLIAEGTLDELVHEWSPVCSAATSPGATVASPTTRGSLLSVTPPSPRTASHDHASSASLRSASSASPARHSKDVDDSPTSPSSNPSPEEWLEQHEEPEPSPEEWLQQHKQRLARIQDLWQDADPSLPATTTSPALAHPIFAPSPVFAPYGRSPW